MKKVFLVDDEQLITLSVAKMIERSSKDYEIVGIASNGQEAWEFLQKNTVDIAIIDIRMPILSGIALLEKIHENKIPVRVIILSAYRDFEYAQKAIGYGASDYLLKPLSQDTLMETLTRVARLVDRDYTNQTATHLFSYKKRQKVIYQLLENGQVDSNELPDSLKTAENGCLLLLTSPVEFPMTFVEDCNEFGWEPYRDFQLIYFLPTQLATQKQITRIASEVQNLMKEYFLPSLTISRSKDEFTVSTLSSALIQCKVAAMYAFYLPDEPVIDYSSIHLFGLTSIRPTVSMFERLHGYIQLGNRNAIFKLLQQIHDTLKVEMGLNPQTLYQLFYEMFLELHTLEKHHGNKTKIFSGITLQHLQRFTTFDSLYEYSVSLIQDYFNGSQTVVVDHDEQIVETVKEFCKQNYASNCTLDDIAATVYISKSYLSQIFKERCGISIWNYFTDIRIEKAKSLLATSEIKANRIGEMVGFSNPSHFGRIFRNHLGVTPKEYREKIRSTSASE